MSKQESGENLKEKLVSLGADKLAEALTELAKTNKDAEQYLKRLIATPAENVKRVKEIFRSLKRRKKFISWRESRSFAGELEAVLDDIREGVTDPEKGIELVTEFFRMDEAIFAHTDDSSGNIGDVFRFTARDLLILYGSKSKYPEALMNTLVQLYETDNYGVRHILIESAGEFLPDTLMRKMAELFWQKAEESKTDEYVRGHWLSGIDTIARQLKDPEMYKKAKLARLDDLPEAYIIELAEIYLAKGEPENALAWLNKIPEKQEYMSNEKNKLLLNIYRSLGDREKEAEIAWQFFRNHRNEKNLEQLLNIIGENEREKVISGEHERIMKGKSFSATDADFLINSGLPAKAEDYILHFREQLNGDNYTSLLPLAQKLEKEKCFLSATVIYRALIDSILERAVSKYYGYAVRYLKKLEQLAPEINTWQGVKPHQEYFAGIREANKKKSALWSKYDEK